MVGRKLIKMVIALKIIADTGKAEMLLSNISVKLPKEVAEAGYDLTKLAQRNLRLELTRQNLVWRKKLWNRIQARRISRNVSQLFIPIHGIRLDRMKPHWVKLKRSRLIRQWAMMKGNERVKNIAKRQGSIYVKPHPWIDAPIAKSLLNIRNILRTRADKALLDSKQGG